MGAFQASEPQGRVPGTFPIPQVVNAGMEGLRRAHGGAAEPQPRHRLAPERTTPSSGPWAPPWVGRVRPQPPPPGGSGPLPGTGRVMDSTC